MPNPKPIMSKAFKDQMGRGRPKKAQRKAISVTLSPETLKILAKQPETRGEAIDKIVQEWLNGTDVQNNP